MNIEKTKNNFDDLDPSENGATEDELQMEQETEYESDSSEVDEQPVDRQMAGIAGEEFQGALSSAGDAVRQVGESSDWETESERLIREVTDKAGQMG